MPNVEITEDAAGIITALLKFAAATDALRYVMYDDSLNVVTDPALATRERFIFRRQSTISGVGSDLFYVEIKRESGTGIHEIWLGADPGRVGFRNGTGESWIIDQIARLAGVHLGSFGNGGSGRHDWLIQPTNHKNLTNGAMRGSMSSAYGFAETSGNVPGNSGVSLVSQLIGEAGFCGDSKGSEYWYPASRLRLRPGGQVRANGPSSCVWIQYYEVVSNVLRVFVPNFAGENFLAVGDTFRLVGASHAGLNGVHTVTATGGPITASVVHADVGVTVPDGVFLELVGRKTATRSRSSNVATVTTPLCHYLNAGQWVTITGLGGAYDGTFRVTAINSQTSFSYASTGSDEGSTADTDGTITSLGVIEVGSDTRTRSPARKSPVRSPARSWRGPSAAR
jgi:hypothetical protein